MDDDSGESLEPMGEVPLILLGESESGAALAGGVQGSGPPQPRPGRLVRFV